MLLVSPCQGILLGQRKKLWQFSKQNLHMGCYVGPTICWLHTCWGDSQLPGLQLNPGGFCMPGHEPAGTGLDPFSTQNERSVLVYLKRLSRTKVKLCSKKTNNKEWKCSQGHGLLFFDLRFSHSTLYVFPHAACSPPSSRAVCAHVCGPPATWRLRLGLGRVGAGLLLWDRKEAIQPTYPANKQAVTYNAILNLNSFLDLQKSIFHALYAWTAVTTH